MVMMPVADSKLHKVETKSHIEVTKVMLVPNFMSSSSALCWDILAKERGKYDWEKHKEQEQEKWRNNSEKEYEPYNVRDAVNVLLDHHQIPSHAINFFEISCCC
jgi:hypothetical protein